MTVFVDFFELVLLGIIALWFIWTFVIRPMFHNLRG